jgi:predicted Zn-dependent protease
MVGKSTEQFAPEESQKRLEAALRGARIAGHRPKESLTPKQPKKQSSKKAKVR